MNISKYSRIKSIVIDFWAFAFITFVISEFTDILMEEFAADLAKVQKEGSIYFLVSTAITYTLYLNKDMFNGQSIGKRITRLKVVNIRTGNSAAPFRCLARNLTMIIFPIELAWTFLRPESRLGDRIASTRVEIENDLELGKDYSLQVILSLIITFLFVFGILYVVFKMTTT